MKRIIIDLEGSDNGPEVLFSGAKKAAEKFPQLSFSLVTKDYAKFEALLSAEKEASDSQTAPGANTITLLPADDYIRCDEPAMSIFKGRDSSSMAVALDALKNDDSASGLLCAGNTGALMVGSIFRLGLLPGLKAPALSTMLPNIKGGMTTLVDCGANVNIEAFNIRNFAVLGTEFSQKMFGLEKPRVALLNVGREPGKGTPLYLAAYDLLMQASEEGKIRFIGNAEGYDIITGYADVVVCDGFAGNIVLKLTEAVGKTALSIVEQKHSEYKALNESGRNDFDTPFQETEEKLKDLFVFNERGGATFLGTKKPVIKMHGCATEETVVSCVEQLLRL